MPTTDKDTNLNSGLPEQDGLDDVARAEILRRLEPRQINVVGNLADLQRAGAAIAKGEASDLEAGVELPPNVSEGDMKDQAKAEKAAEKAAAAAEKEAAKK